MAWFAGLGCFGISVAASARHRVDAGIDPVTGYVIPPVGHAPICVGLVLYGRLQLIPDAVAVIAETGFMAHVTDLHLLAGHRTMIIHEQWGVYIPPVGYVFIGFIVAVSAIFQIFALLFRMQQRRYPLIPGGGTGPKPPGNREQ